MPGGRHLAVRHAGRARARSFIAERGRPTMCVSDNGTELTSMAILRWSQETRVEWHYIAPGKPHPECLHRKLQRSAARRAAERDAVQLARSRSRGSGDLEGRLQHGPTAQRDRQSAAGDLRQAQRSCDATGRDAALIGGSAPHPVAPPSPLGSNEKQTLLIPDEMGLRSVLISLGIVSRDALFLDRQTRPREKKKTAIKPAVANALAPRSTALGERVAKPITVRAAPTKAMPSTSRM